ncbi:MAG: precorrin-6y C5,15-methyltransferase (decarboxylating) subunit CbiE [Bacteroidaceae bacterium]|nr:precorrin-6y C5,15-methyltransferase (decarboxylating) subunit CbiE [Bacteroidaceae bacterium]
MKITIIGIADNPHQWFPPQVMDIIAHGHIFSGGKRHHELMRHLLPNDHEWIDITVPLSDVFGIYRRVGREVPIIVFASGDPLFYGFANTLRREMPEAELTIYPTFNSLQTLAHRLLMPYHDMTIVSLTGRPWHELDRALIEGRPKIGVLTDGKHTPAAIASRMIEYGFTEYTMSVGERLGNPEHETITTLSLHEAADFDAAQPNCLILCGSHQRRIGIPDSEFELLDGRERMITKMPIRLTSLHAMHLERRHTLWDIGSCTGSISIEARLMYPHLHVTAFEVRPEGRRLMDINSRRFSAPGIELHIGDFLSNDNPQSTINNPQSTINNPQSTIINPDAVFIGGHGGKLKEIMQRVCQYLQPDGCICMNSVTPDSRRLFTEACRALGLKMEPPLHIVIDEYNPIDILVCTK